MNAVAEKLVIKRRFDASVEQVYAAWTDAAQMKRWFAPGAMTVPEAEADVRVGGRYRVRMSEGGSDGPFGEILMKLYHHPLSTYSPNCRSRDNPCRSELARE
jgi:uncharacterized protein YndB with AHSA1/START domain